MTTINIINGSLKRDTSVEGQKIEFLTKDIREMDAFIAKNREKPLRVKFEVVRPKRSLDANAYMWVLCDKIADAVHITKEEVYRKAIRQVGVWHDGAFVQRDVPQIIRMWSSNGIGWFVDVFDSRLGGCRKLRLYHGSSLYDSKQMSRLIDYVVDEAKELGIDTATPDEIARLTAAWEESNGLDQS